MNTKQTLAIIFTSGLLLSGCTSDEVIQVETLSDVYATADCISNETIQVDTLREISATLNGFNQDESITRTAYNISETSGFQTVWAANDVLGIYPIGGDQVSFPISDGVGTTTAKFDGGSWALRGTYKYAAYYPFSSRCYIIDQTAIPVNFLGQVQTGNNTTYHLAHYDFMAAAGTQPSERGDVDLQFNHVGCFLRLQFIMPCPGTFKRVFIETDGGAFTTEGTVNLAATSPALFTTATSGKLMLELNNVTTTEDHQIIVLYMMVAPDNLSTHTLTFTVVDEEGNTYKATDIGKNMTATYAYNYTLFLEPDYTVSHEYVDLGLTDSQGRTIYWATCNVGAQIPEDYGLQFVWGETEACSHVMHNSSINDDICPNGILALEYDVAHVQWGGDWRMPTQEELDALVNQCTWKWDSLKKGYIVEGNGNSIFLPAADPQDPGRVGSYWSSTRDPYDPSDVYYLWYYNVGYDSGIYVSRSRWKSKFYVRPVFCTEE